MFVEFENQYGAFRRGQIVEIVVAPEAGQLGRGVARELLLRGIIREVEPATAAETPPKVPKKRALRKKTAKSAKRRKQSAEAGDDNQPGS